MKKFCFLKLKILLVWLVCFCSVTAAQTDNVVKAKEILATMQKRVWQNAKLEKLAGGTIIYTKKSEHTFNDKKFSSEEDVEISFDTFEKIRRLSKENHFANDKFTNSARTDRIIHGDLYSSAIDVFGPDGNKINIDLGNLDKNAQKQTVRSDLFRVLFPITLDSSWYVPLEFSYIGIAESKDGNANVIEAVSKSGTKYRLFFDTKSNLLLMMTLNWQNADKTKTFETKYFYSDYKEMDGLLVASRIAIRGETRTEEITIKSIKVNPKFKNNFFDVKK